MGAALSAAPNVAPNVVPGVARGRGKASARGVAIKRLSAPGSPGSLAVANSNAAPDPRAQAAPGLSGPISSVEVPRVEVLSGEVLRVDLPKAAVLSDRLERANVPAVRVSSAPVLAVPKVDKVAVKVAAPVADHVEGEAQDRAVDGSGGPAEEAAGPRLPVAAEVRRVRPAVLSVNNSRR